LGQIPVVRAIDRRRPTARFALSRQSRRSPNRIYCYTASRSPLAISLSSRATDQQLFSRLQSLHRHPHTKHPASIRSSTPSNGLATFQQIRIDHTFAILRAARSVFRTFPSRPIDPGSRDLSKAFRHLSKAPRPLASRVPIHSHSFGSPRHRSPLRSISRSLAVTPSRTRRRQATSPQQASQFLYLARSLHRPTIAPLARSPFLRLRALLGFRSHRSWGPLPPPCTTPAPRSPDHVRPAAQFARPTTPLRILPRSIDAS
jgi:hypothetical protein